METGSLLLALGTVLLWSSSPALVKLALEYVTPLQVAGLRYFGAFLVLSPLVFARSLPRLRVLTRREWLMLAVMGVLAYPLANGLFFWSLLSLPSTSLSFLLNTVPLLTLGLGYVWLGESPTRLQAAGVALALAGGMLFFGLDQDFDAWLPVLATLAGTVLIAIFGVLGRGFARSERLDSVSLSAVPLCFGGLVLLLAAPPPTQPLPLKAIGLLAWLAAANSALAYLMWNRALKRLKAFEISVVGSLMPIGTALIAPLLLGETVPSASWTGILVCVAGVTLVGLGGGRASKPPSEDAPLPEGYAP